MALVKTLLEQQIKAAFQTVQAFDGSEGKTSQDAINYISSTLASAIDSYIKSATVTVTVASVGLVMPGVGISGPGTGSGVIS